MKHLSNKELVVLTLIIIVIALVLIIVLMQCFSAVQWHEYLIYTPVALLIVVGLEKLNHKSSRKQD